MKQVLVLLCLVALANAALEIDLLSQAHFRRERHVARSTSSAELLGCIKSDFAVQTTIGSQGGAQYFDLLVDTNEGSVIVAGPGIGVSPSYNTSVHLQNGAQDLSETISATYNNVHFYASIFVDQVSVEGVVVPAMKIAVQTAAPGFYSPSACAGSSKPINQGILGLGFSALSYTSEDSTTKTDTFWDAAELAAEAGNSPSANSVLSGSSSVNPGANAGIFSTLLCDTWGKLFIGPVDSTVTSYTTSNVFYVPVTIQAGFNINVQSVWFNNVAISSTTTTAVVATAQQQLLVPSAVFAAANAALNANTNVIAALGSDFLSGGVCVSLVTSGFDLTTLPALSISLDNGVVLTLPAVSSYVYQINALYCPGVGVSATGNFVFGWSVLNNFLTVFDRSTTNFANGSVGFASTSSCSSAGGQVSGSTPTPTPTPTPLSVLLSLALGDISAALASLPANATSTEAATLLLPSVNLLNSLSNQPFTPDELAQAAAVRSSLIDAIFERASAGNRRRSPSASDIITTLTTFAALAAAPNQINNVSYSDLLGYLELEQSNVQGSSLADSQTIVSYYVAIADSLLLSQLPAPSSPSSPGSFAPTALTNDAFLLSTTDYWAVINVLYTVFDALESVTTCGTYSSYVGGSLSAVVGVSDSGSGVTANPGSLAFSANALFSTGSTAPISGTSCGSSPFGYAYLQSYFTPTGDDVRLALRGWSSSVQLFQGSTVTSVTGLSGASLVSFAIPSYGVDAQYDTVQCISKAFGADLWTTDNSVCLKDPTTTTSTTLVCQCNSASNIFVSIGQSATLEYSQPFDLVGNLAVLADVSSTKNCFIDDSTLGVISGFAAITADGDDTICCSRRGLVDGLQCTFQRCNSLTSDTNGFVYGSANSSDANYNECYSNCYEPQVTTSGAPPVSSTLFTGPLVYGGEAVAIANTPSLTRDSLVILPNGAFEGGWMIQPQQPNKRRSQSERSFPSTEYACLTKGKLSGSDTCSVPNCNGERLISSGQGFLYVSPDSTNSDCYADCYSQS